MNWRLNCGTLPHKGIGPGIAVLEGEERAAMLAMAFAPVSCRLAGLSDHANSMAPHPNATPATPQSSTTATSADAGRDERVESNPVESSRVESGRTHAASLSAGPSARLPACPPPLRDDNAYGQDACACAVCVL